nr:DDE-type integrase/transposase/recombinase [Microbacterium marinum]
MAGERRRQASHPPRTRPELVATAPGQVWSWDITKLKGPERGVYYDLYVVLDIFSRFVVGWTIAAREDAEIAKNLLEHAMGIHGVPEAIHADSETVRAGVLRGPDPHSDGRARMLVPGVLRGS